MDPYYNHMHMYGSVPKGKGVDRNMNQFYGRKSLNGLSLAETGILLFSAPVVIGTLGAATAAFALTSSELGVYMKGFQRNMTRKQIAVRNATLGAAIGGLVMGYAGYVFIKT